MGRPKKNIYAEMFTRRKDGRYQYTYTDEKTGARKYLYDKDPAALYDKVRKIKKDAPLSFGEIAEAWKDEHWQEIRTGTQISYDPAFKRAIEYMQDKAASEVSAPDIFAHLVSLKEQDYSAKTIKTQRTVYNLIFSFAIVHEVYGHIVKNNPAKDVKLPPKMKKAKKRVPPEEDITEQICNKAQEAPFGIFALALISTGLRRGETLGLQWGDINFKTDEISVNRQITYPYGTTTVSDDLKSEESERKVPLLKDLKAALLQTKPKNAKSTDYVFFCNDPQKPLCNSTYKRKWLKYCLYMGFYTDEQTTYKDKRGITRTKHKYKPTLTPHPIRHSYATLLFNADVDVLTASKLLGHSDPKITLEIYTHLTQRQKMKSVGKLIDFNAHKNTDNTEESAI